jgi:class 3 adenylate cyclase
LSDELRPVTILFADIVGSTSLSERLSPDDAKALIGECLNRMSRAVEALGGTIQAYEGDGICVYFGVPAAHEDDPDRAGHAALDILAIVAEYAKDVQAAWGIAGFNVRVGINTGQAGVGLVGSAAPIKIALGDATNVAARLEAEAAPGEIFVGSETARRLARHFALEPRGPRDLRGKAGPVPAWRLIGPNVDSEPEPMTPLVGREDDLARLQELLDDLRIGRGQILLVVGDAGIGKTRMLSELRARSVSEVTWLRGTCWPYGREGGFLAIVRAWLGLEDTAAEVVTRMRLRAAVTDLVGDRSSEVIPGLAHLLGVKFETDAARDTPRETNETSAAIRAWIEALAARGPVVISLDSLQWAEPSTIEQTEGLLGLTDSTPLMLVLTFRPDPSSPAWPLRTTALSEYPHRTEEVRVGPLKTEQSLQMARFIAANPDFAVDEATAEALATRAEGNPLFLEELARDLLETAQRDRGQSWSLSMRDLLPSSLGGLILARIDRLPDAPRQTIQAAAAIGRAFSVPVLERILKGHDVLADLAVLLRADLIREIGRYPSLTCAFRHGLIQQAALETLTSNRLRELNRRIGQALEEIYASSLDAHVETLAYHYYRSDDHAKAVEYLQRAASRALSVGNDREAEDLKRRARKAAARAGHARDTRGDPSASRSS